MTPPPWSLLLRVAPAALLLSQGGPTSIPLAFADDEAPKPPAVSPSPGAPAREATSKEAPAKETDEEFQKRLIKLLKMSDHSVQILRNQITANQNAPFLPDLYLQLAEMLSQRANIVYYIQKEKGKGQMNERLMKPALESQEEAIQVFDRILNEFPKYEKRAKVLYGMTAAYKSVEKDIEFVKTANRLIQEHPGTEEETKARLMLGQHLFDKRMFPEALPVLQVVAKSKGGFDANLAKYRIGLIQIAQGKFREALDILLQVAMEKSADAAIKNDDPMQIKSGVSDLRREALRDSIKAYTEVYQIDPKPAEFYEKVAPTEELYQEVIEKLAARYINLRKYLLAVQLYRHLSLRLVSTEKVLTIYRQFLLSTPLEDRISIPASEIRFVLDRMNAAQSLFQAPARTKSLIHGFFEKHVRDLGTRNHQIAKTTKDITIKARAFRQARDFYDLYISYFPQSKYSQQIAINLADVYFQGSEFLKAGELYLRIFDGDFGKPMERTKLIQNSILSLQSSRDTEFYEKVRVRGLLIKGIRSYMAADKSQVRNPELMFILGRTQLEQGFQTEGFGQFVSLMKFNPKHKRSIDAAEVIFDYFGTRSDFASLASWVDKVKAIMKPDPAFAQRLATLKAQAQSKQLQKTVAAANGYEVFAEGKGYLTAALSSADGEMKQLALKRALENSRVEGDIGTFLKAAELIAAQQKDPAEKAGIRLSMARENLKLGRYRAAQQEFERVFAKAEFRQTDRSQARSEAIQLALAFKDWNSLDRLLAGAPGNSATPALLNQVREQWVDALDSPLKRESRLGARVLTGTPPDTLMQALYRIQDKLPPQYRNAATNLLRERCQGGQGAPPYCRWKLAMDLESQKIAYLTSLQKAAATIEGIESVVSGLKTLSDQYQQLEGSGDYHFDVLSAIESAQVYGGFARFLQRVSTQNPELKAALAPQLEQVDGTAKGHWEKCKTIIRSTFLVSPLNGFCLARKEAPLTAMLAWKTKGSEPEMEKTDSTSGDLEKLQKAVFSRPTELQSRWDLAAAYYQQGQFHKAIGVAAYGASAIPDAAADFKAIQACALIKLGLYGEARYHLRSASGKGDFKEKCSAELLQIGEGS